MKTLRAILVDDEPLASQRLVKLLAEQPGIEIAGMALDIPSAIDLLAQERPDIVFLDISMPPENGFTLIPHVSLETSVIFVTGHDDQALLALDANAIDYLLKPVKAVRLARALEKVRRFQSSIPTAEAPSLLLGDGRNLHKISIDRIAAIVSESVYTRVLTMDGGNFFIRRPLKEWQKATESSGFLRLDRSILINPAAIAGLKVKSRSSAKLSFTGVAEPLELGRTALLAVRSQLLKDGRPAVS